MLTPFAPVTLHDNVAVCPRVIADGVAANALIAGAGGFRLTVALADLLGSATLVAVIVRV